jgi:hypothetical protein
MRAYVLGVRALVARNYSEAAGYFANSERRGLRLVTSRPLLTYSLCLSGNLTDAHRAARGVIPHDADERVFWNFLESTFGVAPEIDSTKKIERF